MNAPSVDIKDMLEDETSLGLTFATNLFIGRIPDAPDDCVVIVDTSGFAQDLTFDKAEKYERPSVQIMVRNNDYLTGFDLLNDIKDVLHGKGHTTVNGAYYSVIMCADAPSFLNWDENNRAHFVLNIDMQRR